MTCLLVAAGLRLSINSWIQDRESKCAVCHDAMTTVAHLHQSLLNIVLLHAPIHEPFGLPQEKTLNPCYPKTPINAKASPTTVPEGRRYICDVKHTAWQRSEVLGWINGRP